MCRCRKGEHRDECECCIMISREGDYYTHLHLDDIRGSTGGKVDVVNESIWSSSSQDVVGTVGALATPQGICTEQSPGSHHPKVERKLPSYSRCCRTVVEVSKEDDTAGALHHLMDNLDLIGLLFIPTRELRGANCGRRIFVIL